MASKSGLSQEDYEKTLSNFDPYQYVKDVKSEEILVYLGGKDKLIRSEYGIELLKSFQKYHSNIKAKFYPYADHCSSIYLALKDQARFS